MTSPGKILVTGGAKRIGAALSTALVASGWKVVLHYNQAAEDAEMLSRELLAKGGLVETVQADLANPADLSSLMDQATKTGPLDAVINNASLFSYDDSRTGVCWPD